MAADAYLADVDRRDLPCWFPLSGHDYDLAGSEIRVHSGTPDEDMRTTIQLDLSDRLKTLPGQ